MTELLPCPFCGEKPECSGTPAGFYKIKCWNKNCVAGPQVFGSMYEQSAIAAWNTRQPTPPAVTQEVVEKLVEALKFYASDLRPGDGDVAREALQLLHKGEN